MFVQIPGHARYLIDENGTVVSTFGGRWRVLKPRPHSDGYQTVLLGRRKAQYVHRLVMLAWVGPSSLVVNHKNGDKQDNRLDNLEYVTHAENLRHALVNGLRTSAAPSGERHGQAKLSDAEAARLLALRGQATKQEAASLFGVSRRQVGRIWDGSGRKHLTFGRA